MLHVWKDIFSIACRDPESSHIFLVPIVVTFLVWGHRERLKQPDHSGRLTGVLLIGISLILHEVSLRNQFIVGWHVSAVLCLLGGVVLALGQDVLFRFAAPCVALFMAVPVPGLLRQRISLPLQEVLAVFAQNLFSVIGLNVDRAGCLLSVNGTNVAIAEACNGMRMFLAVVIVLYAISFSVTMSWRIRTLLLLCSPIAALIMNLGRLLITIPMFAFCSESTARHFHDINGWLFPGVLMIATIYFAERYRRVTPSKTSRSATLELPLSQSVGAMAIGACLLISSWLMNVRDANLAESVSIHQGFVTDRIHEFPFVIGDWLGTDGILQTQEVELLKPYAGFRRHYSQLDSDIRLTLLVLACPHARDLVGHEPGICFVGQGWEIRQSDAAEFLIDRHAIGGKNYRFRFPASQNVEHQVLSILVTPGQAPTGNVEDVAAAAADFQRGAFGAAQIVLLADQYVEPLEWHEIANSFLSELVPMTQQFAMWDRL